MIGLLVSGFRGAVLSTNTSSRTSRCSSTLSSALLSRAFCLLVLALLLGSFLLTSCAGGKGGSGGKTLTVQGSDTMEKMVRAWSAAYIKAHPDIQISVQTGDTGIGIKDLIDGKINVAAASRELSDEENGKAHGKAVHLSRTMVAKDAVAIIVGPNNPVSTMTMEQLKGVFSGEIKNWSQISGDAKSKSAGDILVLGRETSSGTASYLRDHVLEGKAFGAAVKLMPSSEAVIDAVEKQREAVGFVGMPQAEQAGSKVKVVSVRLNNASPKEAKEDTLSGSDYPLERPLYLYANTGGGDLSRSFVDFCRSADGQAIVKEMGFITVK